MMMPGKTLEIPEITVLSETGSIATLVEPTGIGASCETAFPVRDWLPEPGCASAADWPTADWVCVAAGDALEDAPVERTVTVV